ncbi:hypothetical protein ABZ208_14275 [Streptomyces sp. NPDC006208]|uniref:hypothetical protein n=1 Tax=Streptomyces sp. NPDC006208 TaxID=3156734 RepID=UPI0033A2E7D1
MRKARWAAAAVGVVLLVAGCSGAKDDKPGTSRSGSSAAPAEAGGSLDAAAAAKEIEDAATAAGFTEEPSEGLPASLKECAVSWHADAEKAADPKKSYDATLAALEKGGWGQPREHKEKGAVITSMRKSGWTMTASSHGRADTFLVVTFGAEDNSAECQKVINKELEKIMKKNMKS